MGIEKVIARIKALRALATSNNPNEAAAAAAAADKLIQEHRLHEAQLEADGLTPEEVPEESDEPLYEEGRRAVIWREALAGSLIRHYGCTWFADHRNAAGGRPVRIIGRKSDVDTVRYMLAWLTVEVSRLVEVHGRGQGRSWRDTFCKGAVMAIGEALDASRRQHTSSSNAIVKLDQRLAEAEAMKRKLRPELVKSSRSASVRVDDAYRAGKEHGARIPLGGERLGGGVTRLLGSGS